MKNNNQNNSSNRSHTSIKDPLDLYAMVTSRIIEQLEKGVIPWKQPWDKTGAPRNMVTKKPYRGVNVWLLSSLKHAKNEYLTYKQVKEIGGNIIKGQKGSPVIFWKPTERENPKTHEMEKKFLLRYYTVFNISQCENIPLSKLPEKTERKIDPITECEKIVNEMPNRPEIKHEKHEAFYDHKQDYINVPKMETFKDGESYYSTLFHEMVHSSGHESRLNREGITGKNRFGDKGYAKEELTAELGASYLKSQAGLSMENTENNAAYIQTWLKVLNDDKKFIVHASAEAQKATDYILNVQEKEKEVEPNEKEISSEPLKVETPEIDSPERESQEIETSEKNTDVPNKSSEREQELRETRERSEDKEVEIER